MEGCEHDHDYFPTGLEFCAPHSGHLPLSRIGFQIFAHSHCRGPCAISNPRSSKVGDFANLPALRWITRLLRYLSTYPSLFAIDCLSDEMLPRGFLRRSQATDLPNSAV